MRVIIASQSTDHLEFESQFTKFCCMKGIQEVLLIGMGGGCWDKRPTSPVPHLCMENTTLYVKLVAYAWGLARLDSVCLKERDRLWLVEGLKLEGCCFKRAPPVDVTVSAVKMFWILRRTRFMGSNNVTNNASNNNNNNGKLNSNLISSFW